MRRTSVGLAPVFVLGLAASAFAASPPLPEGEATAPTGTSNPFETRSSAAGPPGDSGSPAPSSEGSATAPPTPESPAPGGAPAGDPSDASGSGEAPLPPSASPTATPPPASGPAPGASVGAAETGFAGAVGDDSAAEVDPALPPTDPPFDPTSDAGAPFDDTGLPPVEQVSDLDDFSELDDLSELDDGEASGFVAPTATEGESVLIPTEQVDDPGFVGDRREPLMPTNRGAIGHFYTVLPDVGARYTFRFRVSTDFFRQEKFLFDGVLGPDQHSRVRGSVVLGFTPTKWGEIFVSLSGSSSRNVREQVTPRTDVETMFALGDLDIGFKGAYRWKNGIGVGGQLGIGFLASDSRLFTSNVNVWFDGLFAVDVRYLTERKFPFRFTTNVGWFYDSSLLIGPYLDLDPVGREVARFSLGANHNRMRLRFAADFPIRLGKERQFGLDPIVEWSWDVTTQEAEDVFARAELDDPPLPRSSIWMTLGLRSNLYRGLHIDAAIDIGVSSPGYVYGPPVPPWQMILGLGWSFDPKPKIERYEVRVPAPAAPERIAEGRVVGQVLDPDGIPVPDARILFPGVTPGIILTDTSGQFTTYRFPAGMLTIAVEVGGQVVQQADVEVLDGEDTSLTIQLDTMPAPPTGIVRGQFTDPSGQPVTVQMHVVGQGVDEAFDADAGGLILLELYTGSYRATLSAPGYVDKTITFEVDGDGDATISETLERDQPPETPLVSGGTNTIRLRQGIRYQGNEVDPASHDVLDQLAAFLQYHREYEEIQVGVHTDDQGAPKARSDARAEAVKAYLVAKGVASHRITTHGYGDSRPLAVNLTSAGRAKNNRTVITVTAGGPSSAEPAAEPEPEP